MGVPVSPDDRTSAASLFALIHGDGAPGVAGMRSGAADDGLFVQAFARHRIAEREACAKVAEKYGGDYESTTSPVCRTRRNIAAAIRGRSDRVDDISYAGVGP